MVEDSIPRSNSILTRFIILNEANLANTVVTRSGGFIHIIDKPPDTQRTKQKKKIKNHPKPI